MKKTKEELLQRICRIEIELSDLHFSQRHGSFDMFGNKRRSLSEEQVFLSRQLDVLEKEESEKCQA